MKKQEKKYINIKGVNFTYKGNVSRDFIKNNRYFKSLSQCYSNYSYIKERVYNEWEDFFKDVSSCLERGVNSFNCMMFTYNALFTYNNKEYYAYITPTYNYIYEIMEV